MLFNYFRLGFRNLVKNKVYSVINIAGLAIGLACFILIMLYVRHEAGYDRHFAQAANIYRINTQVDVNGTSSKYPTAHYPAAFDMTRDYPEVVQATTLYRAFYLSSALPAIRNAEADKEFEERNFYLTDSSFFEVFDFEFQYGSAGKAFQNAYSVVLTDEMARKYFGAGNPMGKLLQFQDTVAFTVTGVLKPIRDKTHLNFDFLAHSKLLLNQVTGFGVDHAYLGLWYYSYVVLQPGASAQMLEEKLPAFVQKYYPPRYTENHARLTLQNVRDIHLYSEFSTADMSPNGNIAYVYTLGSIAVLVLIIACINFMNLSIARFSGRGKEVGMRKVMGANKASLVGQFLGESVLVAMLGGVLALGMMVLFIPVFNNLASTALTASALLDPVSVAGVVSIVLFTGLLAGLYPSFVMAAFQPVKVLKGAHRVEGRKFDLRKVLVVAQFVVSLTLLMGTLIISDQLSFMRNKGMGFDKDQVVVMPVGGTTMAQDFPVFKDRVLALPGVAAVTSLSHDLGQTALPYFPMVVEGKEEEQMLPIMYVGYDFQQVFGVTMAAGRFFDPGNASDSTLAFVINESAARALGWSDPVGRRITFGVGGNPDGHVIGVIRDFNFDPLRSQIGPLVISFTPARVNVAMKLKPGDHQATLAAVEKQWHEQVPGKPFSFYFLNEALTQTYMAEERLATVFSYFCGLAIFIASLGLFALASFSARRRQKEIGVRKVMGATETGLVLLLYREFFVLLLIAAVVASPLAYYFFPGWLSGFAYRVEISPLVFVIAIGVVTMVAFVTVGYQSIIAARANPVNVLCSE
jgi:putative ABC transport system permease protein